MSNRFFPENNTGFTLLEVLTAMVVLGLALGILIQGTAVLIKAGVKARDTFEASLLLDHLLFEIKSCDKLESLEDSSRDVAVKTDFIPGGCSYRIHSEILGETKTQWKPIAIYRLVNTRLEWKGGKEFLSLDTVVRERQT
ncbi:MAG TPA: prepilin-type N-terminal cleavage/methylation domain-containing protein [Candidatus Omnitrophota bacterium]|nr:prepilin-type N-terminal cleavage/methylation domain-containing protein [Candidatus Omnitrophota bacterium]